MVHVAYFSHTGNTRAVAETVAARTGGRLFRIETVGAYPVGYEAVVAQARQELQANSRPELVAARLDAAEPGGLALGFPNWWATALMAVFAFLEVQDLRGWTLAPFCTHEGSGLGRSLRDLRRLCPGSRVTEGLAVRGSVARESAVEVRDWLDRIDIPSLEARR